MKHVIIKSPAIINFENTLTPIELFDEINVKKLNERKLSIRKTAGYKIPTNHLNPVYKIASELQALKPNKLGADIQIKKNIPTQSGLMSQNSNAAMVLMALNELWNFNLSKKELIEVAKKADPKIAAIFRVLTAKSPCGSRQIILIRPKHIQIDHDWINHASHFPDLEEMITKLKEIGYKTVGISGSGPTIFGFPDSEIDPNKIPEKLLKKADFIWTGKTCKIDPVFPD